MRAPLYALLLLTAVAFAEPLEVAQLPAKIIPEQATTLSLEAGMLSDWADAGVLRRGEVIAVLNKERTAQEREEMELQIARDALSTKDEIRKLQTQRSKVQFYLGLTEKERAYAHNVQASTEEPAPTRASLRDIDERLSLLRRQLESAPRLKRNEFERTHEKLTLRMPFDGRLQYNTSLPEEKDTPFDFVPMPGQHFATVCDDSAFYVTVLISRAELTQLPPERFSVRIALPEGKVLAAPFEKRRVERAVNGSGDVLVYFFRLPQEAHETAFTMLGTHAKAKLIYEAESACLTVSKSELVMRPEASECADWEELISRAYPEHDIVIVGERHIILRRREPS